jgi:hypothetical protein
LSTNQTQTQSRQHKIWLTQEADAKSWSSLKHVQPKISPL